MVTGFERYVECGPASVVTSVGAVFESRDLGVILASPGVKPFA
jgi:hypothetical protein